MKKLFTSYLILAISVLSILQLNAQQLGNGQIRGSFQSEINYYINDSITNTPIVKEKTLMNTYLNLNYSNGPISAGIRFETYQGPLLGYDVRYKGSGIPYRFLTYSNPFFEITAGTFYEQFGTGIVLRAYEERNLGYDNSIDGVRIKAMPFKGITIKGIWGNQRFFWEKSKGIIRGIDAEVSFNEISPKLNNLKTNIIAGGSFISKFQEDIDPKFVLPENVAAFSGRLKISRGKISLQSEYAYKYNDPSTENKFIYKSGQAFVINTIYAQKGLGIIVAAKRNDNMSFRSDRTATGNVLNINYLPALAREQTYSFAAMYPLATQANGEAGFQSQIIYTFKKGSALGGKYGTTFTLAYDRTNAIKKEILPDSTYMGYNSGFFDVSNDIFYEVSTFELRKKISKALSSVFSFVNIIYNQEVLLGHIGEQNIYSKVAIADLTWRLNDYNTLKYELQHLWTKQDKGNWASLQIEYSISPKWYLSLGNQFNYGNYNQKQKIHYYNGGIGYVFDANRIMFSFGRQREGVICAGGICRNMPAYTGFGLSIISSF